jgi:UDP-3-O-acyl-N-acetylglucosamine deacetylase
MDMIGDLYLLGRRLQARVVAQMTGHTQNITVLKKVRDMM